jgi:hypothetical protein
MGSTRYYDLAFFDFGDQLDSALNVKKEIDRFVMIDKQLYGLYNVFGNGVIDGWVAEDNGYSTTGGISVSIGTGIGIIEYMAAETNFPASIDFLPANSSVDVYATIVGSTARTRAVNFLIVLTGVSVSSTFIRIARVITGTNTILSIDNTVRHSVGFISIIKDEIDKHKHRGTPTKIDLKEETKNQLPGARIEGIDASTITSGQFDIERIPILDHNDLENNGLLTHADLDSFVKILSKSNVELLGEIASTNLIKTLIFLKYMYPDIDEHFINELSVIPGVSPDSDIDFESTTAHVSLEDQCISGYPAKVGRFTSIYWNSQIAFFNAYLKDNVVIAGGEVSLERKGSNVEVIEDFEVNSCNADIDFSKEIVLRNDHAQVISQCGDSDKIQGKYSGKFSADTDLRAIFTKNLKVVDPVTGQSVGRNWTNDYDELVLWVKTTDNYHKAVYFYVVNGDYGPNDSIKSKDLLGPFVMLEEDYVTNNADSSMHNFEERIVNLEELRTKYAKEMNNVSQFVIYTDEISSDFSFLMDNIYVRRTNLVSPSGTIRFRYSSETNITFHSIFYDADTPSGTNVSTRVKVASSEDLLSRTSYSLPLSSGQIFAIEGQSAEIEVTLTTSEETSSPVLSSVELRLMVDANFTGFSINTRTEWDNGTLKNLTINDITPTDADLSLSSPINVGGYYFSKSDSVSENDSNSAAVLGFSGFNLPISPNQAVDWNNNPYRKFTGLSSVVRRYDKNYLIADTDNNRVLEVGATGGLVKGFGTTYTVSPNFYPLSSIYNPVSHIISIVFTQGAYVKDITKFSLYIGATRLPLTSEDTVVESNKSGNKVLEILLHEETYISLINVTENLYINFEEGALTENINIEGSDTSKLYSLYGIECFVGDFTYVNYVKHPIFFNIVDSNNWMIANSSIPYIPDGVTTSNTEDVVVSDIVEFNPIDQQIVFSSNYVQFSDFTLGSLYEYETGNFIVAGIINGETVTGGMSGNYLLSSYGDNNPAPEKVKFRAAAIDSLGNKRGVIVVMDTINNKFQIFYNSPDGLYPCDADMFSDGRILIAESSFGEASGRLATLDAYGNVIWSYGDGTFNIISDAKALNNNNIFVSV